MNKFWKPFEEWVTGLRFKPFQAARLKLTAFYILMLVIILCVFSFTLYFALAKNLTGDLDGEFGDQQTQTQVIGQALDHLQTTLILIDIGALILFSFISYILASKTLKPIEQALLAQKQFSADASHELRTPLSIIKHDVEIGLKSSHLTLDEAKSVMQSNLEEVNHMSATVDQLLKLARSEDKLEELPMNLVDLSEVTKSAVNKIKNLALNKNINAIVSKLESGKIVGNFDALQKLVLNLLQNAIDYTPQGGSIILSVVSEGKSMVLIIKDSGIGIEKEDLPHIFKRFYKADNARTLRSNSSGLGLSIVQKIVENHNGKIYVNSEIGKGTIVSVFFPSLAV